MRSLLLTAVHICIQVT